MRPIVIILYSTHYNVHPLAYPPACSYLFGPYSRLVGPGINVMWLLLMVIGLGSVYFHATLSFAGQMIDELAIAWVLLAGFAIWTPRHILSRWPFSGDRSDQGAVGGQ